MDASLCQAGSAQGQDLAPQAVEMTPPPPPLGSGLLSSGLVCAESAFSHSVTEEKKQVL